MKIGILIHFIAFSSFGNIVTINSITEIPIETDSFVLTVFDVDDTLTVLSEPAFQRPNFKTEHAAIFEGLMEPLGKIEKIVAFNLPLLMTGSELIEAKSPEIIKEIQKKGGKVIALTAAMAGKLIINR